MTAPSEDRPPTLFDAAAARDAGIDRAVATSGPEWLEYAIEFVHQFCRDRVEVFCDDIWDAGLARPESPRAFGQVMKHAIRSGWIVKTDRARPSRSSNLALRQVYTSTIYEPF